MPFYDTRYEYKGELNSYFDLVETIPGLKATYHAIPIVTYMTGGKGYKYFRANLKENNLIFLRRVGLCRMIRKGYLIQMMGKITYRYWIFRSVKNALKKEKTV
jgi:hypothetical protein